MITLILPFIVFLLYKLRKLPFKKEYFVFYLILMVLELEGVPLTTFISMMFSLILLFYFFMDFIGLGSSVDFRKKKNVNMWGTPSKEFKKNEDKKD